MTIETVYNVVKHLGHEPEYTRVGALPAIKFKGAGFDSFPLAHKNIVREISKDRLSEFNYEMNHHYIIFKK